MKLNRKQLRKMILKEMSEMGDMGDMSMPEEPVVPSISEQDVKRIRSFMDRFEKHMDAMTTYYRRPYFNDRRTIKMKRPYELLRDQMGASVMDPEVVEKNLLAISKGINRSIRSAKADRLAADAKKIARSLHLMQRK